jgi:P27 family predicted phage terminase small subunit
MGRRGPKKTPAEVKKARGTARADRDGGSHPEPPKGRPECPPHLAEDARAEYDRLCTVLDGMGILYESDRGAIAAAAVQWARWVEAEKQIQELGTVIRSPSGYPVQNPYLAISNKALTLLKGFYAEFGLTPSARAGLHLEKAAKEDDLTALIRDRYGTASTPEAVP